jgi:hypothetical protein
MHLNGTSFGTSKWLLGSALGVKCCVGIIAVMVAIATVGL